MNAQDLAARLNGRECGSEITKDEEVEAKAAGLVVVFGASDDLVELRGAIDDELGAYDSKTLLVTRHGLLSTWDGVRSGAEEDAERYFREKASGYQELEAVWCPVEPKGASWAYETSIPHATFDVMEDGDLYCRGIVFALSDLPGGALAHDAYHVTPVLEFHEAFGHPIATKPTVPCIAQRTLRVRMIAEELLEFAEACGVEVVVTNDGITGHKLHVQADPRMPACDLVEAADGLTDMRYLVDGGNLLFGFPGEQLLAEVHRSNMSKLGADGKPLRREDGKTLKGPNYSPPNIAAVLGLEMEPA